MSSSLLFILLQINLFGSSGEPITGSTLYIADAASQETIGYVIVGTSGKFLFSNLDPGNYYLSMEIPALSVKKVDKKTRQKFDTDIEVAYNKDKNSYCWQHSNGFMKIELDRQSKLAESVIPKLEIEGIGKAVFTDEEDDIPYIPRTGEENDDVQQTKSSENIPTLKIRMLQFTVIGEFGTIGGDLLSISQKEFHKLVVGKNDETLEVKGDVKVLKRLK